MIIIYIISIIESQIISISLLINNDVHHSGKSIKLIPPNPINDFPIALKIKPDLKLFTKTSIANKLTAITRYLRLYLLLM